MRKKTFLVSWLATGAGMAMAMMLVCAVGLGAQENLGRGRITGKVIDESKQAVAGAKIIAQSLTALGTKLETETDKKGGFVVGGMGTGMWRFIARKDGHLETFQDVEVRQLRGNPPLVLVLKTLAAAALEDDSLREAGDALSRGNRLLAEERFTEARELFQKFLDDHPEAYQVRLQIGQCWIREGELEKGEAEMNRLLELIVEKSGAYENDAERSMQALAGLGEAALKRNDSETGMKHFRRALEISPTNEILAYNVAEMFFSSQKTGEAIPYYLLAIQIRKDWPKPYNKLGIAYLNQGDYAKALECLRQFVAMDPENPAAAEALSVIAAVEKMK